MMTGESVVWAGRTREVGVGTPVAKGRVCVAGCGGSALGTDGCTAAILGDACVGAASAAAVVVADAAQIVLQDVLAVLALSVASIL